MGDEPTPGYIREPYRSLRPTVLHGGRGKPIDRTHEIETF